MRREWEPEDLIACWTLIDADWTLGANKRGPTHLGFALSLKFFELEARLPRHTGEIPQVAVEYVASQVKVEPDMLGSYKFSGRTFEYHRSQIRSALGFREATVADEDDLSRWMAEEVCPVELREERLREALLARCRAERIEPPSPSRIGRILGSARAAAEQQFCQITVSRLPSKSLTRLEELIANDNLHEENSQRSVVRGRGVLGELKGDPVQLGVETLLREIDKLERVRAVGLPADLFEGFSEKLVEAWRARAARSYPSDLRASPRPVRLTLLAALA